METRIATAIAEGTSQEAVALIGARLEDLLGGAAPALVMGFASTRQPLDEVVPALRARFPSGVVLGASTAGEFTETGDRKGSVAAFAVAGDFVVRAGLGKGLRANVERAIADATRELPATIAGYPHRTAILLLDPLAGCSEEATLIAAAMLGGDVRLAGGAAGDDLQMKRTLVACDGEVSDDAVVVAVVFSKEPLGVGVCHGHKPISEPLRVTRAEGNVVYTIEGRPAWEVWSERTRASAATIGLSPETLSEDQVGAYLLRYEAGLSTGSEYKIRAPLSRAADGSLEFACGIPEGAVLRITESVPDRQVGSAREAARRARAQMASDVAGAVVFDCICRNLILGERFRDATGAISAELGGVPIAGFETYGEIALDVGDMSGFHNTTTVVLAFPR